MAMGPHVIAAGVNSLDMMPAILFGRRGLLPIHNRSQARFYEPPADPAKRWPPSDEGGLRIADVNGDGLPDILCGNDWMQSPTEFDLPWRIFAIDLWTVVKSSALMRFGWADLLGNGKLNRIAVQRAMPRARLAWFEKPADPQQLWPAHFLSERMNLSEPNSMTVEDFDGDGRPDIPIAERSGYKVPGQGKTGHTRDRKTRYFVVGEPLTRRGRRL
ncbi:MAG: FG-GAP repeat domain-containing protein [Bryobacteraceae bacterium]